MISTLFKQILEKNNLELQNVAEIMGISLDRAKNLSAGRVKKFKPEEMQALISKLGIDPHWLATGEGEMYPQDTTLTLSSDEELLLDSYRSLPADKKKKLLQLALSGLDGVGGGIHHSPNANATMGDKSGNNNSFNSTPNHGYVNQGTHKGDVNFEK